MTFPPPHARRIPRRLTIHGETLVDDYFWLRDRANSEVVAYLAAENVYAEQVLAPTAPLQAELFAEMCARIKETDQSAPVRDGPFFYYSRTEQGRQYPIICRRHGSLDACEEILLDQNLLALDHPFCEVGSYAVSPDHNLLAFTVDLAGSEVYTLFVKDLRTHTLLSDTIPNVYSWLVWAEDGCTLLYGTLDATLRPYRLWCHALGTDPSHDRLVYEEPDGAFFLDAVKTRSRRYILLNMRSTTSCEVRFLPAVDPTVEPVVVEPRRPGHEYTVEHHGERFLIITNDAAPNFRLVAAPVASPGQAHWQELIPHRADVLLEGVDAFRDFLVLYQRQEGLRRLHVLTAAGVARGHVPFPEVVYSVEPAENPSFDSARFRFAYESLLTPRMVVEVDLDTLAWQVVKQQEIPSGYDPSHYCVERLHANAPGGAQVPISLVYKAGFPRDGSGRLLLYGYGAYGSVVEPDFSAQRLSLLDRGFAFAIAHVRGGNDLGRAWYEAGRLLQKKNSIYDLIACAEQLIAAGFTASSRLAIMGGSAGGLLVAAAMTLRPELFQAVVARVPFVDVINTMLDPRLPLVVNEWDEWGNPADPDMFRYMRSYSPYDNVQARAYPHLLITAGLNDPRVCYWEPAKWAARLRAHKTDTNLLLLKTNMGAGHAGASGRYDYLKELAFEFAFLLHVVAARDDASFTDEE